MSQENSQSDYSVVGTTPLNPEAYNKVTGRAVYGADVQVPGLVWGEIIRSPHAHAIIKSIDASKALEIPGVLAFVTGDDLPEPKIDAYEWVNIPNLSKEVLAKGSVHYKGQPVAAIAATDRNTAIEAARRVKIDYDQMPSVTSLSAAVKRDAPLAMPGLTGDHLGEQVTGTNVVSISRNELGDPETGFESATFVIEREFDIAMVHQGYIELQNATARWRADGRLEIWSSAQGLFSIRGQIAGVLDMPESMVLVHSVEIGGGFGGKATAYLPPVVALLAKKTGRPVKIVTDRPSTFDATGPASGANVKIKMGVDDSGRIVAASATATHDVGGNPRVASGGSANNMFSPYDIPHLRVDGRDVVTNTPPTASYRAPAAPQGAFAVESVIDEICEAKGWDKLEFRLKNASHEGTRKVTGPIFARIGVEEVMAAAMESEHWRSPLPRRSDDGWLQGRGVAAGFWGNGGRESSVNLHLSPDGDVTMNTGSVDMGSVKLVVAMQAAEALQLPVERIRSNTVDTDSVGFTSVTGGSRTTFATGIAAIQAAENLLETMRTRTGELWGVEPDDVTYEGQRFGCVTDDSLGIEWDALAKHMLEGGDPVSAVGSANPPEAGNAGAVHIADVAVDPDTGKVQVLRYTAIQDVGKAINPQTAEGQIQGGAVQGIGWALNEEYVMGGDGAMQNRSFLDYRMPTALDLPFIEVQMVEVPTPFHPFGVRGIGEVSIVPALAAVRNAIHNATGVNLYQAPMRPGRVLEGMLAKRAKERVAVGAAD